MSSVKYTHNTKLKQDSLKDTNKNASSL